MACRGAEIEVLLPMTAGAPCPLLPQHRDWDILLTAETHNFPCAVAPFPGAIPQPSNPSSFVMYNELSLCMDP